jgi:GntR family transcriptional repressor for pyruvate dehydrogenase complex
MAHRIEVSIAPIKVLKKSEMIAKELRNQIIRGKLKEGDSLPSEAELISQFQISRPTLREALRILEADALVTVRRGSRGGPVVHLPGPDIAARHFGLVLQAQDTSLADVFRARQLIEPPAVRMVVEKAKKEAPKQLLDIISQEWLALEKRDIPLLSHYATRFHEGIVRLTDNQTLLLIMQMLNEVYYQHMSSEYMSTIDIIDTEASLRGAELSIKAHSQLVSLIQAGDPDQATTYWRDHLSKVRRILFKRHESKKIIDILD